MNNIDHKKNYLQIGGNAIDASMIISGIISADRLPKPAVKVIADATYTLLSTDHGKILSFTSATAVTITANSGIAVTGFNCLIEQAGAGQIGFTGTATIVNSLSYTKTFGANSVCGLVCSTAGTFNFFGDCSP